MSCVQIQLASALHICLVSNRESWKVPAYKLPDLESTLYLEIIQFWEVLLLTIEYSSESLCFCMITHKEINLGA